jgi:hypothetical protein
MAGVRKEGILQVDDVGGSGGATPVEIVDPLGQQLMVDSVSVAIASDQTPVPITTSDPLEVTGKIVSLSGTFTVAGDTAPAVPSGQFIGARSVGIVLSGAYTGLSILATVSKDGIIWANTPTRLINPSSTPGKFISSGFIPSDNSTNHLECLIPTGYDFRLTCFTLSSGSVDWILTSGEFPTNISFLVGINGSSIDSSTSDPTGLENGLIVRNIPSGIQNVLGPLTDAQLRASPVPVTATDLDIRDLVFATDKVDASGSLVDASGSTVSITTMPASSADVLEPDSDANYTDGDLNKPLTQTPDGRLRVVASALVSDTPESYIPGILRSLSLNSDGRLRTSTVHALIPNYDDLIVPFSSIGNPWSSLSSDQIMRVP